MVDNIQGKLFEEVPRQSRDPYQTDQMPVGSHRLVGSHSYRYISQQEPDNLKWNSLGFMVRSIVATFIASLLRMFSSPPKELTASIQAQNPPSLQATQISKISKPILNSADRPWSMSPQEHDDQVAACFETLPGITQESQQSQPIIGGDPHIAAKLAIDPSIGPKTEAKWRECYDTLLSAYTEKVPSRLSETNEDRQSLLDALTLLEKNAPLRYPSSSKEAAITELYDQIILGLFNNTFIEQVSLKDKVTNSQALMTLLTNIVEDNPNVNLFAKCSEKGKAIWREAYDQLVQEALLITMNYSDGQSLDIDDPLRKILSDRRDRRYGDRLPPDNVKTLLA
ncbi:MAG: hypothetical protein NTY13_04140 [Chlamydiae bacterium]|nr:hypothetical protein [Chlamydiota bacterium]